VGKSKVQKICLCRQLFYYLAQLYTPHSIAEIGKKIGKDHTTVSYGIKAVRLRIETVPGWRECVASYREELNKYLGTAGKTHLSCPLCGR
jgi:chromosomal replication initiation ATPase DnaA